ncbi:MAG: hypothetical protein ACO218_07015, partial [Steroidobacteraceae bacterium]
MHSWTSLSSRALPMVALLTILAACSGEEEASAPLYEKVAVEKRSITVAVEAAGTIEPVTTVELKSKASGEVLA